jgi:hypothetical protein
MTGAQLLTYLKTRLGITGVGQDQWSDTELYDFLTEGRDDVKQALSMAAPIVVQELVTFEDTGSGQIWQMPAATKDPLRCLGLRAVTGRRHLTPSAFLDQDGGDYEWITTRKVRLAEYVEPTGGLEGYFILQGAAIASGTAEADIGVIVPLHRLLAKYAAVLALTADEDSDATNAMGLMQRELDKIERLYSEYDGLGGLAFRQALLMAYGEQHGDTLY